MEKLGAQLNHFLDFTIGSSEEGSEEEEVFGHCANPVRLVTVIQLIWIWNTPQPLLNPGTVNPNCQL